MSVATLHETMGFVQAIELSAENGALLEYQAKPEQCHSGGVVQGGFITGWIDAAMAHAAIARGGEGITPMTLELKVSFLAPARPGPVFASAWAVRHGQRTAFYEGELKDSAGTLLAKASSTLMMADRAKVEAASKAAMGE